MKINRITFFSMLVLAAFVLSACTSTVIGGFPSAVVNQDVVYTAVGTAIVAVKPDGAQLWRYPEKADASKVMYGAPLLVENQVVFGDYQNALFGLDATNGTEKWSFKDAKGAFVAGLTLVSGKIIAPNGDGSIYALDQTGKIAWKFTAKAGFWSTVAYDGKFIYAASMDHFLYAIDPANGSQVWATDLGGPSLAAPTVTKDGLIYIGTISSRLLAINPQDGQVVWKYDTRGAIWGQAMIHDNVVFIGDLANKVYAISAKEGTMMWERDLAGPILAGPVAISNGLVVVCETGEVTALGYTNEPLWSDKISNGNLYSSPVLVGERLIFPVYQGDPVLVTYDIAGRKGWTFSAPK